MWQGRLHVGGSVTEQCALDRQSWVSRGLVWFSFFLLVGCCLLFKIILLFLFYLSLFLGQASQRVGFYFPDQELNPGPLRWECEV